MDKVQSEVADIMTPRAFKRKPVLILELHVDKLQITLIMV